MVGRIVAATIVAFWVGMMAALVRMEFFAPGDGISDVPPQVVLRKIFNHEGDARLNVYYQDQSIGFCKVEIEPVLGPTAAPGADAPQSPPIGYQVQSELTLTLTVWGEPSRLRLEGKSRFDPRYEMESFHLKGTIGEGKLEAQGDVQSQKVQVSFEFGDVRDKREFDFAQVQGAGLASAMGLPGLANFSFLGGGGMPTAFQGATGGEPAGSTTTIQLTALKVGEVTMDTYLVESKLDQNMWARMWVSKRGEVLKVDTSFGLTMWADVLSGQPASSEPTARDRGR